MKISFFLFGLLFCISSKAGEKIHYSCDFNNSVFIDKTGVAKGPSWTSKGFSVSDGWLLLDKGELKLKVDTFLEDKDVIRGSESNKGYQFSLGNGDFIYVLHIIPLSRSWTVTGTCTKDKI